MPDATVAKKPKSGASPAPKTDFFVRLPADLALALSRYVTGQKVKLQEQDVIRAALEAFLRAEGTFPPVGD